MTTDDHTSAPAFSWKLAAKHAAIPTVFLLVLMLVFVVMDPSINSERLGDTVGRFVGMFVVPVSLGTSYLLQTGRRTAGIAVAAGSVFLVIVVVLAVTGVFSANKNPLTEQERAPLVADQGSLRHPHLGISIMNLEPFGFSPSNQMAQKAAKRFGGRADTQVYAWSKGNEAVPDSTVLLAFHATDKDDTGSVKQFVNGLKLEIGHKGGLAFHEDTITQHTGYTEARIRASVEDTMHIAVRVVNPVLGPDRRRYLLFVVVMGTDLEMQKKTIDSLTLSQ